MKLQYQVIINTTGNVAYLAAQWFLTVLATRFLGYEAVGILTLAMSVSNVFTFIQLYGVRNFQGSDVIRQYSSGDYLMSRFATSLIGLLCCAAFLLRSGYTVSIVLSIAFYTLFRTSEAVSDVFFGEFQRSGYLEFVGISMFLRSSITVVFFLIGLKVFQDLNKALLLIVLGATGITLLLDLPLYRRIVKWKPGSVSSCKNIIRECFPLLLATLLPSVITTFPRVLLDKYCGSEVLGYYGNVSTPAVIITAIVPNILAALMPIYGAMSDRKDYVGMRKLWLETLIGTAAILIACLLGVLIVGKPVLAWIYTESIKPYVVYLYFLMFSTYLYATTMCNGSVLIALRDNRSVSRCAVFATAICVVISFPLVKREGIPGAIAVLTVSYFMQAVMQAAIILRDTEMLNDC